jgi:hypothetical protein
MGRISSPVFGSEPADLKTQRYRETYVKMESFWFHKQLYTTDSELLCLTNSAYTIRKGKCF